jgi:hypothetical protein
MEYVPSSASSDDKVLFMGKVQWVLEYFSQQKVLAGQPAEPELPSWAKWMNEVYVQDQKGNRTGAVALFIEKVDDLLWDEKFNEVDDILESIDTDNLSVPMTMGVLCITKPAMQNLSNRKDFFDRAWNSVKTTHRKDPVKLLEFFRNYPAENEQCT